MLPCSPSQSRSGIVLIGLAEHTSHPVPGPVPSTRLTGILLTFGSDGVRCSLSSGEGAAERVQEL